jgi:voltage-gated potassium channel Kch
MRDVRLAAWVFAASLAYAIARYNVFGTVSVDQIPLYIVNKALSVASLVLLGLSRVVDDKARRKWLGFVGLGGALVHCFMSLLVLQPAYLPKHFKPDHAMQWNAETSMLAGLVSTVVLVWLAWVSNQRPVETQRTTSLVPGLGRIALALVAVHTLLLGYTTWPELQKWPGGMPPITLLSFGVAVVTCLLPPRRRRAA